MSGVKAVKAVLEARALSKALGFVGGVIERRNTIPVLSRVLLRFDSVTESLELTATDLDIRVATSVHCGKVDFFGSDRPSCALTIPTTALTKFIGQGDGKLVMEYDAENQVVDFEFQGCNLQVRSLFPAEDFPVMAEIRGNDAATMAPGEFAKVLRYVSCCISKEETRYYLNGAYVHPVDGVMQVCATDGHRMALYSPEVVYGLSAAIWPTKALQLVGQLVARHADADKLMITSNSVEDGSGGLFKVALGNSSVTFKTIDGTFPDYTRVIPEHRGKGLVDICFAATRGAVSRLFGSQRSSGVKFDLEAARATVNDCGEGVKTDVPIGVIRGRGSVGFNLGYVNQFLTVEDELTFSSRGPGDPAVILAENAPCLWVLMPMRV